MGTRTIATLALCLAALPAAARAQTTETTTDPAAAAAPDASAPEPSESEPAATTGAATDEASAEPLPDTPPGYEHASVPTPPEHAGTTPRRTSVAQARDDEHPGASTPAAGPSAEDANVELAINVNALLNFSSSTTPMLAATADLVVALDPRAWIGLGISFSYAEQHTTPSPGFPDMKFVTTSVSVPLTFQYYLDAPHVGAAVPTLRVLLTPGWSESPVGSPTPSTQVVTGSATVLGGITWMATHWLALRIIGGLSGGFGVNVVGPVVITGSASVLANVSMVVRF